MRKIIIILVSFFLFNACDATKMTNEEKDFRNQQIKENIESRQYTIEVTQARPQRSKTITLSSIYYLTISNDSAIAYLPFFGRSTHIPYSDYDGGIQFRDKMEDYRVHVMPKNHGWIINFKISTIDYNYQIKISIFADGNSTIDVISLQRDAMFFSGEMRWSLKANKENE